jgi:MFS family permease
VIYLSCAVGAAGLSIVAIAPGFPVAVVGSVVFGLSTGIFLAVDWALMTDIIPKASAGRYMGLSNIVEATNGPTASALGGVAMYSVGLLVGAALGARFGMFLGVIAFGLGALFLRPVVEPRRVPGGGTTPTPGEVAAAPA